MPRARLALAVTSLAVSLLGACDKSPGGEKKPPATAAACAKFGDTCEVSPGKLGSCVQKDECANPPCLVCQSQH